jgi:hypothetical protein
LQCGEFTTLWQKPELQTAIAALPIFEIQKMVAILAVEQSHPRGVPFASVASDEYAEGEADSTGDHQRNQGLLFDAMAHFIHRIAQSGLHAPGSLPELAFGLHPGITRESAGGVLHPSGRRLEGAFNLIFVHRNLLYVKIMRLTDMVDARG